MNKLKCTVLVVGGGPAGATAARELNKLNINNILLEKNLSFNKPCGGGIMLEAFDEFDIPTELIRKKVNKIQILSTNKEQADVDISSYPIAIVNRQEFDATLRQLAVDSGTKLINAKAYNIKVANKVTIYAKNKKKEFLIECDYLISADGVNSIIRKKLLKENPTRILTYYADIENKTTQSCQFWFGDDIAPKHYAWVFPSTNGINVGLASNNIKNINKYFN